MDLGEKEKFRLEMRGDDDHLDCNPSALRLAPLPRVGLVSGSASLIGDSMGSSPCQSVTMVETFCSGLWDHPNNSHCLGFCETSVQPSTSVANTLSVAKSAQGPSRLAMGWSPSDSLSKSGIYLQAGNGILPPGLSQFPADSAFIERAARFSSFNGSSFSGAVSPFSSGPHSSTSRGVSGTQSQKKEHDAGETFKDVSMPVENGSACGSPMMIQRDSGSLQGVGVSSNESGDPILSGSGQEKTINLENATGESSSKAFGAKKRKRGNQDMELDLVKGDHQPSGETSKENIEAKLKAEQNNLPLDTTKSSGKHAKDSTEEPKEDYIHVRARRGQATNSHSLAERVRREKISERMKFLQDLVPGCNKVTGKAVMLDEIINYVQSLQRQVEFLSMKLATVNPQLDFNIEGLLSKDILQPRAGSSSTIGFSPDMLHPQLHPSQQDLVHSGIPGMGNPSDALRRAINAQLTALNTYKEPMSQLPNSWDDELDNVVHMGFETNGSLNIQELTGSLSPGHTKVEL